MLENNVAEANALAAATDNTLAPRRRPKSHDFIDKAENAAADREASNANGQAAKDFLARILSTGRPSARMVQSACCQRRRSSACRASTICRWRTS